MSRLQSFFSHAPQAIKSAGHKLREFSQRPMGRVMIGAGLIVGAGLLMVGTAGTANAATGAAVLASTSSKSAGIWKAVGITALAVGYIYGQIQIGLAMGRAAENRDRERKAEEAKKKAREEKLEKLKRDLEEAKRNRPPAADRRRKLSRRRLPQPA